MLRLLLERSCRWSPPLSTLPSRFDDDYETHRAAAVKLCGPTKTRRRRRTFSASYAPTAAARKTAAQPFAIRPCVPACLICHTLSAIPTLSCAYISCRSSSTIYDGCLDFLPTQVAFFVVAAAERADADFNHDDAIHALGQISTSNCNIVPLDVHRATDDDEIEDNHIPITTKTRDILLKALNHTQNTVETHIELQTKADWPLALLVPLANQSQL